MGLNCADVLVGNVGCSARLSFTALDGGVNVAARLEGANKQFGTTICISNSIYDQARAAILARKQAAVKAASPSSRSMNY